MTNGQEKAKELNKDKAIQLRDFLNEFIEEQNG